MEDKWSRRILGWRHLTFFHTKYGMPSGRGRTKGRILRALELSFLALEGWRRGGVKGNPLRGGGLSGGTTILSSSGGTSSR